MGLIKQAVIVAILGTMLFGLCFCVSVGAQVSRELPQFNSGASINLGIPVNSDILYQRANMKYEVMKHNDSLVVWKLKDTTGDWVYVSADGKILVASTADFNFASMDNLINELNDAINFIKLIGLQISDESKTSALESADFYASKSGIYHRLKYDFKGARDVNLVVPNTTIKSARFTIKGTSYYTGYGTNKNVDNGQNYLIDDQEITSCGPQSGYSGQCGVPQVDITDKLLEGTHKITADRVHESEPLTMIIEILTGSKSEKPFILHCPDFSCWINETSNSFDLKALNNEFSVLQPTIVSTTNTNNSTTFPGNITGIDPTSHPKVKVNVFVNTSCAKSGGLKKEDFNVKENGADVAIDSAYFTGNASGQKVDLAVVFDDTGSMGEEISAMKSKVEGLTDQIKGAKLDARYALVTFKDIVSTKTNWTDDPLAFKNYVNSLEAKSGGDEPEDAMDAIEKVFSIGFRPDAQKVILVITDAHAHYKGDGTNYSIYTKDEFMKDIKNSGAIFIPVSPTFKQSSEFVDLRDIANKMQSLWIDINSADFATILEQFKGIIIGTYVLEYTSPDLTPGTNRKVTVVVNNLTCNGAVGNLTVTYINPIKT
jgi:hypothetical protein